jgi:hypothetical protein
LSEHVVQIAKTLLARLTLIINLLMHLITLVINVRYNLLFVSYSGLLLLDQPVLDAL